MCVTEYIGYTPQKGKEYLEFIEDHLKDGFILTLKGMTIHKAYCIPSKKKVEWCRYIDPEKGGKKGSQGDLRPEAVMKSGVVVSTDLGELKIYCGSRTMNPCSGCFKK